MIYYRSAEAKDFIIQRPHIGFFLIRAIPELIRCFDTYLDIYFEIFYDPEACTTELFGMIQWDGDVRDGLDRLEKFDEEWFLSHYHEVDNELNFNLECIDAS